MPPHELVAAASGSVAQHGLHLAAAAAFLVVGLAAAAFADARDAGGKAARRPSRSLTNPLVVVCGLATVAAAAVHVYVIPEHFAESPLYGAFFVSLATVQLAWAAAVMIRPARRLLVAGVAANASVVALWLATRLVAVPLGPGAGSREEFGRLDVLATSCELAVIVAALLLLTRPQTLKRNSVTSPSAIT